MLAHFLLRRTLEGFDFHFQPSIGERQIREFAVPAFAVDDSNVIFPGPPGVGESHLAVALGVQAIEHGYGVYFVKAHDLLDDLRRARLEHRLDRRLHVYLSPKVLIADEFGVCPYDRTPATLVFALVSTRYERGNLILTSNKGCAEGGDVLDDPVVAAAILDRLLHYSRVLSISGESCRLIEKRRAGLFGRSPVTPSEIQPDQVQPDEEAGSSDHRPATMGLLTNRR